MFGQNKRLNRDEAELIALAGLAFIAKDPSRLDAFISLTGFNLKTLKQTANTPETLVAVLAFLREDESMLLSFSSDHHLAPELIEPAHEVLFAELTDGP